jgi:hypothetical protein
MLTLKLLASHYLKKKLATPSYHPTIKKNAGVAPTWFLRKRQRARAVQASF